MSSLLSIVVVSFNTRDLLRRCLDSIAGNRRYRIVTSAGRSSEASAPETAGAAATQGQRPASQGALECEIIVVDNGSADESAEMVEREFPGVRVIRAGANLGFARATNIGIRASSGQMLLMLNPDTEVIGDALAAIASFLSSHPQAAAAGPSLAFPSGELQHGAFRFPSIWMSLFDFFPVNHRVINSRLNGRYRTPADGRPYQVDHLLGAAMMVRREALDDVGLLDEEFFMYCEEVDWCMRARRAGWDIYQLPAAKVIHHVGQSTRQFRREMLVALHESRYRLFRKHYSPGFIRLHRAVTRLGLLTMVSSAHWAAARGRIDDDRLRSELSAYRTIWGM